MRGRKVALNTASDSLKACVRKRWKDIDLSKSNMRKLLESRMKALVSSSRIFGLETP